MKAARFGEAATTLYTQETSPIVLRTLAQGYMRNSDSDTGHDRHTVRTRAATGVNTD